MELQPLSEETRAALLAGELPAAHVDTLDAARMGAPMWLVVVDGEVIGDCGTFGPPDERGDVEIGYGLAAEHRGRGHGTELVRRLVALLFGQEDVRRIVAHADNDVSAHLLERSGFVRDGERWVLSRPRSARQQ